MQFQSFDLTLLITSLKVADHKCNIYWSQNPNYKHCGNELGMPMSDMSWRLDLDTIEQLESLYMREYQHHTYKVLKKKNVCEVS